MYIPSALPLVVLLWVAGCATVVVDVPADRTPGRDAGSGGGGGGDRPLPPDPDGPGSDAGADAPGPDPSTPDVGAPTADADPGSPDGISLPDGPDSALPPDAAPEGDSGVEDAAPPSLCGNARVDPGEDCDNGAANSDTLPGACRTTCRRPRCGDGVVDPGEQCDDGNTNDGDGCSNACIPVQDALCTPCTSDTQCGRPQDRCLTLDGGRACGVACTSDGDCPEEFRCGPVAGVVGNQCIPRSGVCAPCFDPDGDGWGVGRECLGPDCDEARRDVNPGAAEVCDGIDNNCNGQIDEGLPTQRYWVDADGDGFGAPGPGVERCGPGPGWARNSDDCDDTRADTFPGAPELCDGRDNNCDGRADEGIESQVWPDADGDGFGDARAPAQTGCPRPGFAASNTDCDDTNNAIRPGATEVCNGRDMNCDGQIDNGANCGTCAQRNQGQASYLFCGARFLSWTDAQTQCRNRGYTLATVNDLTENTWIRDTLRTAIPGGCTNTCRDAFDGFCDDTGPGAQYQICDYGTDCRDCGTRGAPASVWIGLNDRTVEGTFVWESADPSPFRNWNSGEPNNRNNEDCVELRNADGLWNDLACGERRAYVCEVR
jgi:cysteine-rich repeat protein